MKLSLSFRLTEPRRQQQYSFKISLKRKKKKAWKSLLLAAFNKCKTLRVLLRLKECGFLEWGHGGLMIHVSV